MLAVILSFILITLVTIGLMLKHDRGEKEPRKGLLAAFGFGVFALIPVAAVEYWLLPADDTIISVAAVGLIEETAKFFPLALYIYRKRYFNEHTDGIIYFALCGAVFGLSENILYTLSYGVEVGMARLALLPIFHAASTAIIGYFLAKRKLGGSKADLGAIFFLIAGAHALYNFGLAVQTIQSLVLSVIIAATFSMVMIFLYVRAGELDGAEGRNSDDPVHDSVSLVGEGRASAALIFGVIGLVGWLVPILGLIAAGLAFWLGIATIRTSHRHLSLAAIVLSVPVLALSLMMWSYNVQAAGI